MSLCERSLQKKKKLPRIYQCHDLTTTLFGNSLAFSASVPLASKWKTENLFSATPSILMQCNMSLYIYAMHAHTERGTYLDTILAGTQTHYSKMFGFPL